jgi:hypothetical protein
MRLPRHCAVRTESVSSQRAQDPATSARLSGAAKGVRPAGLFGGLCQLACNVLPEPLKSICKAAC